MPPIKENISMIFGVHNKIDNKPKLTQEFDFYENSYPKFYTLNMNVILSKD